MRPPGAVYAHQHAGAVHHPQLRREGECGEVDYLDAHLGVLGCYVGQAGGLVERLAAAGAVGEC